MKIRIKVLLTAVLMCLSISIAAGADKPYSYTARAMLVQMPAVKFHSLSSELKLPGAMEVVGYLFADADVTLAAYSQVQINAGNKNLSSENRICDRMRLPIRKLYGGTDGVFKPMIEYTWVEDTNHFKLTSTGAESKIAGDDKVFRCNCSFEYKWAQIIPYEQLEDDAAAKNVEFIKNDLLMESRFACDTYLSLKIGSTAVAGSQKIGEDYYILLINISDK